jgi:hypothetical protein
MMITKMDLKEPKANPKPWLTVRKREKAGRKMNHRLAVVKAPARR